MRLSVGCTTNTSESEFSVQTPVLGRTLALVHRKVHHCTTPRYRGQTPYQATRWGKLEDRVRRGVGNPCPLVLIGLPASIVTFGENPAVVEQLLIEGEKSSGQDVDT